MLDPTAECPDCNAKLGAKAACPQCGWRPAERVVTSSWSPPAYTPPTPSEDAEIRRLIAQTNAKLRCSTEPKPGRKVELVRRCPACETGNFVHAGLRFCLACYRSIA